MVAKHTAQREQDIEDLGKIAKNRLGDIDWKIIQHIANNDFKTTLIKQEMEFLAKIH